MCHLDVYFVVLQRAGDFVRNNLAGGAAKDVERDTGRRHGEN
jgi:hypothetical protein